MNDETQNDLYKEELVAISKNAGISGSGILIGYFLTYLITVIATRVIGAEAFGVFYLAQTILVIVIMIATLGLNQGVLRYLPYWEGKWDSARIKGTINFAFKLTSICSIFMCVLLYFFSPFLSFKLVNNELTPALRIIIIALPFAVGFEIFTSALQGLRFIAKFSLIRNIIFNVARLTFMVLLFAFGLRLNGLLWALVLSYAVSFFMSLLYFNKLFFKKHAETQPIYERRKILRFSNPLFWDNLFNQLIAALPVFILEYFNTSESVGILGVCLRIGLFVSFPLMAINIIFAPTISNLYAKHELGSLERLFKIVTKWSFTISLAVSLILILLGEPILKIFGTQFTYGTTVLAWVVLGQFINAAVGSVGYILSMTGRPQVNLMNSVLLTILTFVLGYFFIREMGLLGAALTISISNGLINILRLLEVYYFEKIHPYNWNYLKPLLSGFTALCLFILIREYISLNSLINSVLFGVAFIFVFSSGIVMAGLDEDDIGILRLVTNKVRINLIR